MGTPGTAGGGATTSGAESEENGVPSRALDPANPGESRSAIVRRRISAIAKGVGAILGRAGRRWPRLESIPSRRWWILVLLAGFLVRFLLAPITAEADLATYAESSATTSFGGGLYTYLIVYPPGWVLILTDLGRIATLLIPAFDLLTSTPAMASLFLRVGVIEPLALPQPGYVVLEKTILFAFDFLLSILIYKILRDRTGSEGKARLGFALWFLNPFVIVNSAIHGAYDVVPAFFTLASVYLLFQQRALGSGAALGVGTVLKLFPALLLPLIFVGLRHRILENRKLGVRQSLLFAGGFVGVIAAIFWPPGLVGTYQTLVTTGPTVGIPYGGLGVWSFVSLPGEEGVRAYLYFHSAQVGVIDAFVASGLIVAFAVRYLSSTTRPGLDVSFEYAAVGSTIAAFVFFATVQVQYLLWVLPWMVLILAETRRLRGAFVIIISGGLLTYLVALAGPLYFFQPLAVYSNLLTMSQIQASIDFWANMGNRTHPAFAIPVALALGVTGWLSYVRCRGKEVRPRS